MTVTASQRRAVIERAGGCCEYCRLMQTDATLSGKTPEGRVTLEVLKINDERRVQYRQFAMNINEYPCKKV